MRVPRPDLVLHFAAGNICVALGIIIGYLINFPGFLVGAILAVTAGVLREIYNEIKTQSADMLDFIYTVAGALPVVFALAATDLARAGQ